MPIRRAISAVLPAYNEQDCIVEATEKLRDALAGCAEEFEIILVDDGSTDRTPQLVDELSEQYPEVRTIHHKPNAGYGVSLRDGFLAARLPLVFYTDADNQFDPREIPRLIDLIDRYDIVSGYRIDRQDPWMRKFFSWGFKKFIGAIFGVYVRDCDCAFKLYRRKVFKHVTIESRMFFVDAEVLAKANVLGYRIGEVGVTHLPRSGGQSTVRLGHIISTLREAWHMFRHFDLKPDPSVDRDRPRDDESDE
ncbi:MAG: glycosyltransferase family 2 protein [Planctomycetes bacterium]|nr:glycosyltransferase family 2 protein [Planctomycetota bacterium]